MHTFSVHDSHRYLPKAVAAIYSTCVRPSTSLIMSFGCSVGDIISVSALAWKVFKACKESSEEFKNLLSEVASLHLVLKETEELVAENGSSLRGDQGSQLLHIAGGCHKVLNEVEGLLEKYESLGTKSQRTWDRMKWGVEGIANVRTRADFEYLDALGI